MDNRVIDTALLRKYLLGRLEADQELVERIDEQILTEPEFSTSLDIIEDEIIEEYLEGSLNEADSQAFEQHFLRPPERQRKFRNARLISRRLANAPRLPAQEAEAISSRSFPRIRARILRPPGLRAWAEIAASILFAACILYLWNQQRKIDLLVKQNKLQTARELERSAAQSQQSQALLATQQASAVTLSLVTPGLLRGGTHLREVTLASTSKMLQIEVALTSPPSTRYKVELKREGAVVWSLSGVHVLGVPGGAILTVDVPADVLPPGTWELVVTPPGETSTSHWFLVSKLP